MADNQGIHLDGDGEQSIGLHNPLSIPVSLADYFLTDQIDDLRKWMFPPCEMEPELTWCFMVGHRKSME